MNIDQFFLFSSKFFSSTFQASAVSLKDVDYKIKSVTKTGTLKFYLPKTGQITSYADYDDGYYHLSIGNATSPRFIDNEDNTISDRATGLMWINRPELIIPHGLNVNDVGVEKGDWTSEVSYVAGDIVTDSNDSSAWICLISNNKRTYAILLVYTL